MIRWLLLDEVVKVSRGKNSVSRSRVPAAPYAPEFLMIEMMAQTAALLIGAEKDFSEDLIFAKIESAEFFPGYRPGDALEIEASAERISGDGGWLEGRIKGPNGPVAQARFLLMTVGHFTPGNTKPITFHEAFMNHFKIREKVQA